MTQPRVQSRLQGLLKLIIFLCLTAVLATLVWRHVTGINGPWYWQWPWRSYRGLAPYGVLLAAAIPLVIAELRFAPPRSGAAIGIILMMGTTLGFELAVREMDTQPPSAARLAAIIEDPGSTEYFTHAKQLVDSGESIRSFLQHNTERMAGYVLHAQNKPPGAILFYVPFLRSNATEDAAAIAAGVVIAILATLTVPATYLLVREVTADRAAAFHAGAFISLCPGLVLFLPEFDQFYPVYSCAMIILWMKALKTGRYRYAIAFAAVFAFVCFQTFNLLVLGVFIAGYAAWFMGQAASPRKAFRMILRQTATVILVTTALYGMLWLWSGYNPIRAIIVGVANHKEDMPATHRVWPTTIPFDLTDFALGTGWISFLLAAYFFFDAARSRSWKDSRFWLVLLCIFQPLVVAILGILQTETARVWIFMFPLLMVPVGLELARWRAGPRLAVIGSLWLLTALLAQNMVFV